MIFAMVCNVSMAFASWGGMGYKNCVLCGALVTPMPTYGGTQKYTEFYNCEEVEGLTSSTTQRYALKNMYVVSNADGVICTNCVERIISEHKGGTGGEVDESVYIITVPESVTLSNENGGTGDYANTVSIKATGKLLTNQKVFFNTSAPTMHRDGSTDVVCTATATTATEWDATAVKGKTAQTDYSVTAHLTPGEWTGNMVFYASVGDTYTVEVGDNSVLLSPAYEDKTHIVFESDNPSVSSISSDGHIIASAIGTANITKTAYDSTGTRVIYSSKYITNVKGIVAVLYRLFRLFAWRQGDARFVIEARRRKPFELKQMTQDTAVFETEVPLHNAGRQLGTIMDFYPRTLLPREQYDKVIVHSQLANKAAERDDNYWESVIFNPGDKGMIRVTIALVSKDGNIREDLKTFPDMPIDLVYQVVSRSEWYIHKARITLKASEVQHALEQN